MGDFRIVSGGQNEGPIVAANVRNLGRANALVVVLVNVSGDIVNPGGAGGGAASDVNLNQVGGTATAVGAGNSNNGTQRVVIASDQGAFPVTATVTQGPTPVTGVQIVGGFGGAVNISGDPLLRTVEQAKIGVHVASGLVGVSGDVLSRQAGAWAMAVTGDVLIRSGGPTIPVAHQGPIGVNIIGGSAASQVAPSGDFPVRIAAATSPLGISGDVSTKPAAGNTWPVREQGVIGVYIAGGSGQGTAGISGDVGIRPSTTPNIGRFPVSGDTGLSDGLNRAILATVKNYTRANPLTVVIVNASGDAYNAAGVDGPNIVTVAGRVTSAGSNSIVGAVGGKRVKVISYDLQGDGDTARGYFASGASGAALTVEWELASREGVVKQVPFTNDSFIFGTSAGQGLSFESSSAKPMKYAVTYHVDDSI